MAVNLYSKDSVDNLLSGKLSLSGGTMASNAALTFPHSITHSKLDLSGYAVGVLNSLDFSEKTVMQYDMIYATDGTNTTEIKPDGIHFTDGSTQVKAGVNIADAFSFSSVREVIYDGSSYWTINFAPLNSYVLSSINILVENLDGSVSEDVKGSATTTSNWTYDTTGGYFSSTDSLYLVVNGVKATLPINQ